VSTFAKPQRLLCKAQFDWVFADATKFSSKHFTFLVRLNLRQRARLGLAIAKKADPRAVGRNRVKRLLREAFRLHLPLLPALDVIVLAKPQVRSASSEVLLAEVEQLLETLKRRAG